MPTLRSAALPVLLGAFLCFAAPARAATLNVPTVAYPTIQAAVDASQNGDTVLVADGTYSGPGNRDIDFGGKSLTVASQHGAASTVIDCGGSSSANHRGFRIHHGETSAVISGLTIENGYTVYMSTSPDIGDSGFGGGIIVDNSSVTIQNCVITGNTASQGGGGIYNNNAGATITVTGCTITNNTASNGVGGVGNYNPAGKITMIGSIVTGNAGGGIDNSNYDSSTNNGNGTIALTNCTISGNTSTNYGAGGVSNSNNNGLIVLTNCTISGNADSNYGGGGVFNSTSTGNTGTITFTGCTITGNTATQGVGGIFNSNRGGNIRLTDCIAYGDTGGEVLNSLGTLAASFSDIQGGYAGAGNINADPLFVNAAGGDLHLKPGSPCFRAGTSTGAPAADKDGVARPSPPTIGAYEGVAGVAAGHTHLLWNDSDGRVMLWSIAADGTFTLSGFGPYTDGAPQNKWSATAVATGADGVSHLLWNNTDGRVMLWTVNDAGSFTLAGYGPYTDNAPQNKWSAIGVSVGPDNVTHLLWTNTDRRAMLWNVASDFTFTLAGFGPYTDGAPQNLWSATALATGPDNVSRIVWNNTDNRVMLWKVDTAFNFTLAGYGPYTDGAPQNLWSAAGVSVGPDNTTHLLWSNTDRRAMFWDVDSAFGFTLAGYGPYTDGAPQNLWTATALATGPDGLSHLLWGNTDNRAMLWGISSAFSFTVAGYGPYTDNAPGNLWGVTAVSAGP